MKKPPMIGSAIGASAATWKRRTCRISTSTPAGVSLNVQITRIPRVNAFRCKKRSSIRSRSTTHSEVPEIGIPERSDLDNAALRTLLEETDIAVMRQDARPLRKIGGGLEDRLARSVHDDRVAGLHGWRRKKSGQISLENPGAQ